MPSPPEGVVPAAVALLYHPGEVAPQVIAKGRGWLAAEICRRAEESGVYVHAAPELVSLLMQLDLDARIPESLYGAVAEVLAWLYHLERQAAAGTLAAP